MSLVSPHFSVRHLQLTRRTGNLRKYPNEIQKVMIREHAQIPENVTGRAAPGGGHSLKDY